MLAQEQVDIMYNVVSFRHTSTCVYDYEMLTYRSWILMKIWNTIPTVTSQYAKGKNWCENWNSWLINIHVAKDVQSSSGTSCNSCSFTKGKDLPPFRDWWAPNSMLGGSSEGLIQLNEVPWRWTEIIPRVWMDMQKSWHIYTTIFQILLENVMEYMKNEGRNDVALYNLINFYV